MENVYPTIIPNFDRSPRSGKKTNNIWHGSTPELFGEMVEQALDLIKDKARRTQDFVLTELERMGRRKLHGTGFEIRPWLH